MRAFTAAGEAKDSVSPAPLTTKGDLVTHDGTDAVRLGVGTDGKALIADSTQSAGIKWGDVTVPDDSVTLLKIQNFPTDSLLGRDTTGTGDPEIISVTGGIEFTGSASIRISAFTGDVTKTAGGTVLTIANGVVTDTHVAAANKDGAAGTASMRTLGTGGAQACAGNDSRLSDDRTASGLRTASTVVSISGATAPTSGQVLTATSGTAATWQTPSGGGGGPTVASLTSDHTTNSTTTGVKVTGLDQTLQPGTYVFEYFIRYQAAATTTGVKFGINFTGTQTAFMATSLVSNTGTTAVATVHDQENSSITIMGTTMTRTLSTTAPNRGPATGVAAANADMLWMIRGLLIVTVAGDIQLYHGSEVAAASTVKAGSSLILTKTN